MREIKEFHDPSAKPEEWRFEELDGDGDGSCFVAIFGGHRAEERAKRFADRLRSHTE